MLSRRHAVLLVASITIIVGLPATVVSASKVTVRSTDTTSTTDTASTTDTTSTTTTFDDTSDSVDDFLTLYPEYDDDNYQYLLPDEPSTQAPEFLPATGVPVRVGLGALGILIFGAIFVALARGPRRRRRPPPQTR